MRILYLILLTAMLSNCSKEIYIGQHSYVYLGKNNYSIQSVGELQYSHPEGKPKLAEGFNIYSIHVLNGKAFLQEFAASENAIVIGKLNEIPIYQVNEDHTLLSYDLSGDRFWIIEIFKDENRPTEITEFLDKKKDKEFRIVPYFH